MAKQMRGSFEEFVTKLSRNGNLDSLAAELQAALNKLDQSERAFAHYFCEMLRRFELCKIYNIAGCPVCHHLEGLKTLFAEINRDKRSILGIKDRVQQDLCKSETVMCENEADHLSPHSNTSSCISPASPIRKCFPDSSGIPDALEPIITPATVHATTKVDSGNI